MTWGNEGYRNYVRFLSGNASNHDHETTKFWRFKAVFVYNQYKRRKILRAGLAEAGLSIENHLVSRQAETRVVASEC